MSEKYESEQARSEHSKGAAIADLLSALEGKLSRDLDAQLLVPHRRKRAEGRVVNRSPMHPHQRWPRGSEG